MSLLTTAGYLGFDLSGLPGGVRDVRLTATELEGSVRADQRLQTLHLNSERALEMTIEPATEGDHDGTEHVGATAEVLSAVFAAPC